MAENDAENIIEENENITEEDEGADDDEIRVERRAAFDGQTGNVQGNGCYARIRSHIKEILKPQRLSALLLFLLIFAISLTFIISQYLDSERFLKYRVNLLIIILEVIASVVLVLTLCWATTKPAHVDVDDDDRQPWQRLIRRNIRLFGIVPFFFAIFVFDVIRFCVNVRCSDAWTACASSGILAEHMTDLLSPVFRFFYLLIELIVCVKLNEAVFFQNLPILLGLAIVEATNLSCWLDALVDESIVFSPESNWTHELSQCFNRTNASVSDHFIQCYSRTTPEYHLLESVSPYLYPFIMEYLMLVMECVADWFFSDAEHLESAASKPNNGRVSITEPGADAELEDFGAGDRQRDVDQLIPDTSTGRGCPKCRLNCCPRFFIYVVVIVLMGFLFLLLGIFALFVGDVEYWNALITYHLIYWMLMLIAAVVGYAVSFWFPAGPKNPSGFEYFVTLSSIGPILQCILWMVAITQTDDFLVPTGLFVTEEVFNLAQIVTQLVFYEKTKTTRIQSQGSKVSRVILKCVIVSFIACNFALWVENSFIETGTWTTRWQKYYFEKWPLLYNIFNPLSLMFRFNSALLFLNVLFDNFDNKRAEQNPAAV